MGTPYPPVCGAIVAVVGQEVIVEFPEDMESDSAIGRRYIVVCLTEHGVDTVQCQKLTEELMGHPVYVQQSLQLLINDREKKSNWNKKHPLTF